MTEFCTFTEPQQGASYADLLAFARATEESGFDGYFRSDHYLAMGDGDGLPGPTDAWTTLAGLARETSRIRLGTLVSSATFRHPGILAIQVAQVDQMSAGRAELGLGTGWFEAEHRAYGIPFPAKRFDLLEDNLAIVTGLWSTPVGETFSYTGAHYTLSEAPALPKPVQSPVPVIVGGSGPRRTPALAARYATEFNIGFVDDQRVAEKFAGVRAACEQIGRDPGSLTYSVALPTVVGRTRSELAGRLARIGQSDSDDSAAIVGAADQVIERVARLVDLGADRVYFQLLDLGDLDQVALLGEVVATL